MTDHTLSTTAELAPALGKAAQERAHIAVTNALIGVIPKSKALNRDYNAEQEVRARLLRAFDGSAKDITDLIGTFQPEIIALRLQEQRAAPFATRVYDGVSMVLTALGPTPDADTVKAELTRIIGSLLAKPAVDLSRAAGQFRLFRDGAIATARPAAETAIQSVRRRAESVFARHTAATAAAALFAWADGQRTVVALSAARVRRYSGSEEREQREDAATQTRVARGRTAAEHRYSLAPAPAVLHAHAAQARPDIIGAGGRPTIGFWQGFGAWQTGRGLLAAEQGAEQIIAEIESYTRAVVTEIFPSDLSLGQLYEHAGQELPVLDWEIAARPRVKTGAEAEAPMQRTVVEAPPDLAGATVWQALGDATVRAGTDPRRVIIARLAHGYTLMDLLRGDGDDVGALIEEAAARAGTPVFAEAERTTLPRLLGLGAAATAETPPAGGPAVRDTPPAPRVVIDQLLPPSPPVAVGPSNAAVAANGATAADDDPFGA